MVDLGDTIEIYCRYCRLNLNGIVSAIVDGKVVKVKCKTCGHFQDYQPPKDLKKLKEKALKRLMKQKAKRPHPSQVGAEPSQALSQASALRKLWEQETADADFRNTKVYDPHRSYRVGDFIAHKHFGLGKVMEIVSDTTMRVLFRTSIEELEHGVPKDDEDLD